MGTARKKDGVCGTLDEVLRMVWLDEEGYLKVLPVDDSRSSLMTL